MGNYRQKTLGLLNQVVAFPAAFDKTNTYIKGHVTQKTVNSVPCLGAAQTQIIDTFTDTGGAFTGGNCYESVNNRLFVLSTSTAGGIATICLYNFDTATGVRGALIGRIQLNLPATTHTFRMFAVADAGTTGWSIALGSIGTLTQMGGTYRVHKVDLADFTPSPTIFYVATTDDSKGIYFEQDPTAFGGNHTLTAIQGGDMYIPTKEVIVNNGVTATTQLLGWDFTTTPTLQATKTATAPTVAASPTFTVAGHGFEANAALVMTANNPTPFVLTTPILQTVYYVRATNLTANTFELSATLGGAAINATSATAGTVFARAFGLSLTAFMASRKTAIFTGASVGIAGTILLTNSHNICIPPAGTPNAGLPCLFLPTSSNFHLIRLSEITAGASSFANLAQVNALGGATDITAPTVVQARYSETLGAIIYSTGICSIVVKGWVNNAIIGNFFGQRNEWYENIDPSHTSNFGFMTLAALESRNGFIFMIGSTVGQRVLIAIDLYSSATFGMSYFTTPITNTKGYTFKTLETLRQNADVTNSGLRQYKTSANYADTIFDNPDTGWTSVPNAVDESGIALLDWTMFRVLPRIFEKAPYSPSQTSEILLGYIAQNDNSEKWSFDGELSTKSADNPAYSVAYLDMAYQVAVPSITMTAVSKATGLIVRQKNTVTHAAEFKYSSNAGGTWNSLGTIPNVAGTRLQYSWGIALPEDVEIIWSET